jgi:hypothetical protein
MLAQHGIGPAPQLGELRIEGLPVQVEPGRRCGAAGRGGVQYVGKDLGEFLDAGGEVQVVVQPGPVETIVDLCGYDGSSWPRRDGLKWPRLPAVAAAGMVVSA